MTGMSRVIVATTLTTFAMDQEFTWSAWLINADAMRNSAPDGIEFFAAIEVDARGLAPFEPLLERLYGLNDYEHDLWWTFNLDDGRTTVSTKNRLRHITTGQNLCMDRAASGDASHLLFVAADCEPPPDVLTKLRQPREHIVAAHSPTYCLPSQPIPDHEGVPDQYPLHVAVTPDTLCFSAACVLFDRVAFRALRWRWDKDTNMTDDPCMQHDAWYNHGWPVYVRPHCITRHHPESIPPIEYRGHDLRVVRE